MEAAKAIVLQYYNDMTSMYKLNSSSEFSLIKKAKIAVDKMPMKNMDISIVNVFGASQNDSWLRLPFRCMLSLYCLEKNLTREFILDCRQFHLLWK